MAQYEKVFNAFGTKAWAQVAAATVIGALAGVGAAVKMEADAAFSRWWVAVGGALVGLFAGVLLASVDVRRKRVAAGVSRPFPWWAVLLMVLGAIVLFLAICVAIVVA